MTENYQDHYTQPIAVLDLAWDALHGASDAMSVEDVRAGLDFMVSLMERGVAPHEISRLFDIAITAYRAHEDLTPRDALDMS